MKRTIILGAILSLLNVALPAGEKPILKFNGKNLTGFYNYLGKAKNQDPDQVFSVTDEGLLRISGQHPGYLSTIKKLSDYRMVAEFKWGEGDKSSDSGIFFHAADPDKLWAKSLEVQMRSGATGDLCLIGKGAALTTKGQSWTKGCIPRPGNNDEDIENPRGTYNTIELICKGDTVRVTLNGKIILVGTGAHRKSGRIFFQSYSGELFYRKIVFYPLQD